MAITQAGFKKGSTSYTPSTKLILILVMEETTM